MICVSLAGLTFEECVTVAEQAEFAEVRIDQLELSTDQLKELFSGKKKTIATCRPGKLSNKQRMIQLKTAIESGAGFVDIEYESDTKYREELTAYAQLHHCTVIISYHNFENTPSIEVMESIIGRSKQWKADLVKITTTAISKEDCSNVMALYARHENIIAFCMGQAGKITRIAAPLLGAEFTYAAWNNNLATAPGQLTVDELKDIYDVLE